MKIDNSLIPSAATTASRVKPQANVSKPAKAESSESVQLSPLAEQLHASEMEAPVDRTRVEQIKQAIAEGRFSINADAIAGRLLDSARDLVNYQRKA